MLHCPPQEDHYLLFSQGVEPKAVLPNMLPNAPLPAAGRSLLIVFTGSCTKRCIAQHVTQCSTASHRKIITYCFHRELYQKLYCPTCYLMHHCPPQEDHYLLFSQGVVPKAVLPNMLPNAPLPATGRSLLIVFTGSCTKSCIAQHVTQCSTASHRKIITCCFHRELYQKQYCPTCYLMFHCQPQEDHYLLFSQGVVPKAVLPNM